MLIFLLIFSACSRTSPRTTNWPQRFLWAWERPEKLDFLDARAVGVAYLAQTVTLKSNKAIVRPRLQPLAVPPGAVVVAVTRIETDARETPALSAEQRADVVKSIVAGAQKPQVAGVQIDFDATSSQRDFYRALLAETRRALPENMALTMTALASWCNGDDWLTGLPVDEAVPMLFRLGVEKENFRAFLQSGQDFREPLCRHSYGIATDEPLAAPDKSRRFYIFNPQAWTSETATRTLTGLQP